MGVRVIISKEDLANIDETKWSFYIAHSIRMVQCLLNIAMTLEPKVLVKHNEQSFDSALATKQRVSTNFDQLSRTIGYRL